MLNGSLDVPDHAVIIGQVATAKSNNAKKLDIYRNLRVSSLKCKATKQRRIEFWILTGTKI